MFWSSFGFCVLNKGFLRDFQNHFYFYFYALKVFGFPRIILAAEDVWDGLSRLSFKLLVLIQTLKIGNPDVQSFQLVLLTRPPRYRVLSQAMFLQPG